MVGLLAVFLLTRDVTHEHHGIHQHHGHQHEDHHHDEAINEQNNRRLVF